MAKRIAPAPDTLHGTVVTTICSVSGCLSPYFADYIDAWRHNGWWLFDTPAVIRDLVAGDTTDLRFFYYELHPEQYDERLRTWSAFAPEPAFAVNVAVPSAPRLLGFDIVTYSTGTAPECSPLSCNGLAREIATNRNCLLPDLATARALLNDGHITHCEPGPYRIVAVHEVT